MAGKSYGPICVSDNAKVHLGDNHFYGDRERLKYVPSAVFNAYRTAHSACHPETRRELLGDIQRWAEHENGKSFFWLNGMAGTGKSTIAYTVAEWLNRQGPSSDANLGASFFFRRGERDRSSAVLFFPTIIRQLSQKIPSLSTYLNEAIDADPDICTKSLGEQFDRLVKGPLCKLDDSLTRPTYVVVVDALDECQNEEDIQTIIKLWSSLHKVPRLCIRWFLTSRPELPIQLGFSGMSADARCDMMLHEIPRPIIENDIAVFLTDAFAQIRKAYNSIPLLDTPLPEDWPGAEVRQKLCTMAVPLFIIAVTICRFIQDSNFNPQDQLQVILQSRTTGQMSHVSQIYLPILERAVPSSVDKMTRQQFFEEFLLIVGAVVTVAEPLSCASLSTLLHLSRNTVALRLRSLHSVLQIPKSIETPIRTLHLSFGEFLSSPEIQDQPFYADRGATHKTLLTKCLELLSRPRPDGLGENMCSLDYPGHLQRDIAHKTIQDRLSPALQYACRYWVYHAKHSGVQIKDNGEVHRFLQQHFLHWLESLSLLDYLDNAIEYIDILKSLVPTGAMGAKKWYLVNRGKRDQASGHITSFLEDARRFILANRYIASLAPLQLYSSAIVFAPRNCLIRNVCGQPPGWILQCPITPEIWDAELQKLEGHTDTVNAVAFSPNGSQLASGSNDGTVRVWDAKTGREIRRLEGHTHWVNAVAFSPDGSRLVSGSDDKTIRVWDARTGREVRRLEGHTFWVRAVAFSPDGSQLASGSYDKTVRVWETKTGREIRRLEGHTSGVNAVAFSPDGSQLASGSDDKTVRVWDTNTGREIRRLEGHTSGVNAVAFSPDGSQLASGSDDKTVRVWETKTGRKIRRLRGHTSVVYAVAFSPDGSQLASGSDDETVRVWDTKTGRKIRRLEGHTSGVYAVAFSPDRSQLASGSDDKTVRVWDTKTGRKIRRFKGHTFGVSGVAFSLNGSQLASGSDGGTVRVWDTKTGREIRRLEGHTHWVNAVAFSPDGSRLISGSDDKTVRVWDTKTGREVRRLEGHTSGVNAVAFSPDGSQLASGSYDETVRVWDKNTGREIRRLKGHTNWVNAVAFSPDGSQLVSGSNDRTVRVWNAKTGQEIRRLEGHNSYVRAVAFSLNGSQLASGSYDETIRVWEANTGKQVEIIENQPSIIDISFIGTGQTLSTNRGNISVGTTPSSSRTSKSRVGHYFVLKHDWVECEGKRVLWLPHEYRSEISAVYGITLAIGRASGLVSFIQIQYP